MDQHERLFLMTDPATRKVVGLCTGPDSNGKCPRASEPPFDCIGLRVVPSGGRMLMASPSRSRPHPMATVHSRGSMSTRPRTRALNPDPVRSQMSRAGVAD